MPTMLTCRKLRPEVGATKLEPKWSNLQPLAKMCLFHTAPTWGASMEAVLGPEPLAARTYGQAIAKTQATERMNRRS